MNWEAFGESVRCKIFGWVYTALEPGLVSIASFQPVRQHSQDCVDGIFEL